MLIAGGGPAGSSCAWKLRQAGLDVVVVDKADFPRDKVCAGWITPQVIEDLALDPGEYRRGRTFQPITGFRVGLVGDDAHVETDYDRPVSFGIRRCEFDDYLLRRSGARLALSLPITNVRFDGGHWNVNDAIRAPMLVGAGGHFCPVARTLNGAAVRAPVIAAQEAEFAVDSPGESSYPIAPERPELYFCRDLRGYGWCFRKQGYLNVGFGRLDAHALPRAAAGFVDFLKVRGRIPADAAWPWRGHAYLVSEPACRQPIGDGVLLIGDAAGLAYPQSGEGIRPAIESGLLAASAILDAKGDFRRERLQAYADAVRRRFGAGPVARLLSQVVPPGVPAAVAPRLLRRPWFVRHVVLDRWFLHRSEPPISRS